MLKKFYLIFFIFFIHFSFVFCDNISLSASIDKNEVSIGEDVYYTINIKGILNPSQPKLQNIDGLSIFYTGSSSSISMINGAVSSNLKLTYIITPAREGIFQIPQVEIESKGRKYFSNSVSLKVNKEKQNLAYQSASQQGSLQNSLANSQQTINNKQNQNQIKDLFITNSVNKRTAFINEPIILTFKLYNRAIFLSQPFYTPSITNGFWKEELPFDQQYQGTHDGVQYNIYEKKSVLYPTI
ncbi:MAG: BatD family protein, partial [Elusimicrobiota bacterium]|nr:BatD family protein [Elusimicrobiota bacterium]